MRPLHPGQDTVLSWPAGAIDCRVVAAAGAFVLLRPGRFSAQELPMGVCSLTFLDGMIPMGWDGEVEFGGEPGELRFRVNDNNTNADRRSSVRLPIFAGVTVTTDKGPQTGQLLDVSAGGMRFRAPERLELGSLVHVRCPLPADGPVIDAHASVRGSEPGIAAVEFTALHEATAQEIGAWTVGQLRSSLAGRG